MHTHISLYISISLSLSIFIYMYIYIYTHMFIYTCIQYVLGPAGLVRHRPALLHPPHALHQGPAGRTGYAARDKRHNDTNLYTML